MNRFMHPRNPYRSRPDFAALARDFPHDLAGAFKDGKFDFSDRRNCVKLSKCLLKNDFGLDIEFPTGSLAPSLTLKLNYLLWIQDLISESAPASPEQPVVGMDVGCGGAVLFPALAVKVCDWSMVGVESDPSDVKVAQANVQRNALNDRITIVENPDKSSVLKIGLEGSRVDFTMCNPPFYDEQEYSEQVSHDQDLAGRRHEMSYPGGELAFVLKMIDESRGVSGKVGVFTTMLGHKKNLGPLKKRLREDPGRPQLAATEFCQGKTMRWALGWTFDPEVKLAAAAKSEFAKSKAKKRAAEPFVINLGGQSWKEVHQKVKELVVSDLSASDVEFDPVKGFSFRLTRPTWRNQRAKKRRKQVGDASPSGQDRQEAKSDSQEGTSDSQEAKSDSQEGKSDSQEAKSDSQKGKSDSQEAKSDSQKGKSDSQEAKSETLLQVNVQVLEPTDSSTVLKFTCDTGSCSLGRGGLYELVQYFRNKLCPDDK